GLRSSLAPGAAGNREVNLQATVDGDDAPPRTFEALGRRLDQLDGLLVDLPCRDHRQPVAGGFGVDHAYVVARLLLAVELANPGEGRRLRVVRREGDGIADDVLAILQHRIFRAADKVVD